MNDKTYWVYILYCSNNSYYTGYTDHLIKRFKSHVAKTGRCKYTRSFPPHYVSQVWVVEDKSRAMQLEAQIKQLSRREKELLISEPQRLFQITQ